MTPLDERHAIVLLDGVCVLCNRLARFVIRRDRHAYFRFCHLQSKTAHRLLRRYRFDTQAMDTVVLIADGCVYTQSHAVLNILAHLPWPWSWCGRALTIVPSSWRNVVYAWVGRHRYRWFGRHDTCMLADASMRERFIADDIPGADA